MSFPYGHITDLAENLANEIRAFSRRQDDLWQRVPWLALEADGRTGYDGRLMGAYLEGYWGLGQVLEDGKFLVYVDLATGELVGRPDYNPRILAPTRDVLLLANHVKSLDASFVISELVRLGTRLYRSDLDPEKQAEWRVYIGKKLNLWPDKYLR